MKNALGFRGFRVDLFTLVAIEPAKSSRLVAVFDQLKAGDVLVIPAGTGHQFTKIDDHITYFERAYQSGLTLSGGGLRPSRCSRPAATTRRAAIITSGFISPCASACDRRTGHADNHLMWRGRVPADPAWAVLIRWLEGISADTSNA